MKHSDISEIFAGLLLDGKIAAEYVLPNYLAPPYDLICSHLRDGRDAAYIIDKVGLMPVVSARQASATIGDTLDLQTLLAQLLVSYRREQQIITLEKEVKRLRKGEDLDVAKIVTLIDETENYADSTSIWTRSTMIQRSGAEPFTLL